MRKWTLKAGAFLFLLALGISVIFVWARHRPVSLCQIDANPQKYAGKTVRLRMLISNDNGFISGCSVCSADDIAGATIDLDSTQAGLLREGRHTRTEESGFYLTDAIVVGRFESPDGMLHCFTPKYYISNARIERVLARHEFENGEKMVQWFKSEFP